MKMITNLSVCCLFLAPAHAASVTESEFFATGSVNGVAAQRWEDTAGPVDGTLNITLNDRTNPTSFTITGGTVASRGTDPTDWDSRAGNVASLYNSSDRYTVQLCVTGGGSFTSGPIALTGSGGNYTFDSSLMNFTLGNLQLSYAAQGGQTNWGNAQIGAPGLVKSNVAGGTGALTITGGQVTLNVPVRLLFSDLYLYENPETESAPFIANMAIDGRIVALGSIPADATGATSFVVTVVPEPSTYGLLGTGVLATAAVVRRRRRAA